MSLPFGFGIAIAVLTVMISIGGIALGIGYASNNKNLRDFGRDELYQSAINGIIIGAFIPLFINFGIIPSLISSITLSSASAQCPAYLSSNAAICFAYGYLSGGGYTFGGLSHPSILSQSTALIIGFLGLNTVLGVISSTTISIGVISFSPASIRIPIINKLQFFIKALTAVSISSLVQSSVLSAIAVSSLSVLLPIGIILRTFFPTRKLGGFMIGSVLGLYIILPLSYLLNAAIINSYSINTSNSTIVAITNASAALNNDISAATASKNQENTLLSGMTGALQGIVAAFSGLMNQLFDYISYFIMAAFILPAFSIALTAVSVKEFSALFGSEINFNMFDLV